MATPGLGRSRGLVSDRLPPGCSECRPHTSARSWLSRPATAMHPLCSASTRRQRAVSTGLDSVSQCGHAVAPRSIERPQFGQLRYALPSVPTAAAAALPVELAFVLAVTGASRAGTSLKDIASATTHPTRVHPKKRLMTAIDPRLVTPRWLAMIVGRKYTPRTIPRTMRRTEGAAAGRVGEHHQIVVGNWRRRTSSHLKPFAEGRHRHPCNSAAYVGDDT